eukprot:s4064_g2.t1
MAGADTVDKESVFANYKSVFSRQFAAPLRPCIAHTLLREKWSEGDQFLSNEERLALKLATLQQFHEEIVEEAAQSQQEHDNMLRKVEQRKIQAALKQAVEPDFMCPILHERMKVPGAMSSLRGEYGFLTIYDGITDEEAAARVNYMATVFDVREWQFYDAVEGYSAPPALGKESWQNTAFFRPVQRRLILAYVRAIRAAGGRSWLYVQAMATDPGDAELQKNAPVIGQHKVDGRPLLDVMPPTHAWAKRIAPRWATFAAEMEFSGIHWDTLGDFGAGRASRSAQGG